MKKLHNIEISPKHDSCGCAQSLYSKLQQQQKVYLSMNHELNHMYFHLLVFIGMNLTKLTEPCFCRVIYAFKFKVFHVQHIFNPKMCFQLYINAQLLTR